MRISTRTLDAISIRAFLPDLVEILVDTVEGGAAISFMQPMAYDDAESFWMDDVAPEVEAGHRTVFAAAEGNRIVGTVQVIMVLPPNQPHRCEIAKMIVHPNARRKGIGRALMTAAVEYSRSRGKTLATLDTRTGDVAESLYRSVGFEVAGVIPDFAWDPDGGAMHATTYMFMKL